jgi:DNA-binding CsgD family transcriptional regulator
MLRAMSIALPFGFITPFAVNVPASGGLVEQCLKRNFPSCRKAVLEQANRTIPNWIRFYNQFAQGNITLILWPREIAVARRAAQRVPYAKIAEDFGVSVGRIKNIMQGIYGKLHISGKAELTRYVM